MNARGRFAKQERSVVRNPRLYVHYREFSLYKVCASSTNVFPHSTNYTGNGYKHSVQQFLASFEWTSVTCDWLMVSLDTIDSTNHNWRLSTETIPEITATNTCTHSPSSFRSGELPFFCISKEGEVRFLVCTDVAARGIDITGVPYGKSWLRTVFYLPINTGATVKFHPWWPKSSQLSREKWRHESSEETSLVLQSSLCAISSEWLALGLRRWLSFCSTVYKLFRQDLAAFA